MKTTKNKFAYRIIVAVMAVLFVATALVGCQSSTEVLQEIDTTESLDYIANPDRGFYRPAFIKLNPDGGTANTPVYNDISLYHLRIDISAFSGAVNGSADMDITPAAVNKLAEVLSFYEQRNRSVIVRFAYDPNFGGAANKEPSLEKMLAHIDTFAPILQAHNDMLTAVEVGMVGPWGEMHTSTAANKDTINALIERFLQKVSAPVLVRTPRMIYNYLGITVNDIEGYNMPASTARLGMFNDGYLGSGNDLGTYTNREKETDFLAEVTAHLPYGGEVTVPSSTLHDIDKCLPEMFKLHLSYLNYEWNNEVVQTKWKNATYTSKCGTDSVYYGQSAFKYIQNRLGYRLLVQKSVFKISGSELNISLAINNVGFGNLNRTKNATVVFVDEQGNAHYVAAGEYSGGDISLSVNIPSSGSYDVYLMLHSGTAEAPTYCVAFANNNMFSSELNANRIGKISV